MKLILSLATAEYTYSENDPTKLVTDSMTYFDPRLNSLGCRMVCPKDSLEIDDGDINKKDSNEDFELIRLLYCIPEGPKELKDKLPLNFNLHKLNGVSFHKGCYVGQELTQRTFHSGVIRKILMPFIIADKLIFSMGESGNIFYIIFFNFLLIFFIK